MSREPKSHPCAFCGSKATRLCGYHVSQHDREVITCDTPLCSQCAVTAPVIGIGDSLDYCPVHTKKAAESYPVAPVHTALLLSEQDEQILKWRLAHNESIRKCVITKVTS